MSSRRIILSFIASIVVLSFHLQGQNFEPIEIPFKVDGVQLQNPLIGGMIAPQFSSFDLDGEGAEDLIIFERNGNVLLPFINNSTPGNPDYTYAPEYTNNFPRGINFVQFHDFNGDGLKDMFTGVFGVAGIGVYKNVSSGGEIAFEKFEFNLVSGFDNALVIPSGNGFSQIYLSNIDIPAIIDVDGDEDLDILTFGVGGSYIYYYKNMVKEMNLPADTFAYRISDLCWGDFIESGVDESISLSDSPGTCSTGLVDGEVIGGVRHSGSTVTAFDGDGDGDLDMVLGDLSNEGLVYLENGQSSENAFMIGQDTKYPSNSVEVNIPTFLGSFFIDIDNDGKRDLIATPNYTLLAQNINHVWYYRNVGEDNAPIFELVQKDFFHETTLRMGTNSSPVFLDYNADGLQDLLVGNHKLVIGYDVESSLYLYENIGTKTNPAYELVDDDYLDMMSIVSEANGYLAPSIGDLDSDGDDDLIVADKNGYIFFFENTAPLGQPYNFKPYVYQYFGLRPGLNCKVAIQDMDEDGLNDLVIGEKNSNTDPNTGAFGGLNYYKNYGSVGSPLFYSNLDTLGNTSTLGDVYTGSLTQLGGGSTTPEFIDTEDGLLLSVGSAVGTIRIYNDIYGNLDGQFTEIESNLPILHSGRQTMATYADIDDDNFYEVIVGNDSGGLIAFNTTFKTESSSSTSDIKTVNLTLYPNPTGDILNIQVDGGYDSSYKVYTIDGQLVRSGTLNGAKTRISTSEMIPGVYMVSILSGEGTTIGKFVKM